MIVPDPAIFGINHISFAGILKLINLNNRMACQDILHTNNDFFQPISNLYLLYYDTSTYQA